MVAYGPGKRQGEDRHQRGFGFRLVSRHEARTIAWDKQAGTKAIGMLLLQRHRSPHGCESVPSCVVHRDFRAYLDSIQSLTDRTLDQMCTVTRPGVAPIASATAVELMVSLIQHSQGYVERIDLCPPSRTDPDVCRYRSIHAPADLAAGSATTAESSEADGSPLGLVPHQLRGFLAQFRTMLIEGPAYDRCTGCSATVSPYSPSGRIRVVLLKFFRLVLYRLWMRTSRTVSPCCFELSMKTSSWNS